MQSPLSTKPQPEPDNKCPDCLYLELKGIPVKRESYNHLEFWATAAPKQQIELYLTIHFNEQWEALNQGRVKFGLKGGELRLKLKNSEIPYESRQLSGSLELYMTQEGQGTESHQVQKPIGVRPSVNQYLLNGNKTGAEQELGQTERFPITVCHVTTKVSEENPAWIFEEEMGEPVLKGLLNQVKLGTLNVLGFPCLVEATFEVSKRDVCLTDVEGLWSPNISRNKKAVLDRLIIQRLLEPQFKPYLSRAELHYG